MLGDQVQIIRQVMAIARNYWATTSNMVDNRSWFGFETDEETLRENFKKGRWRQEAAGRRRDARRRTGENAGGDGGGRDRRSTTPARGTVEAAPRQGRRQGGRDAGREAGTPAGTVGSPISVSEAMGKKSKRDEVFGLFKVAWKS
ncbi:hypothetical protein Syun_001661 [Stephania yunnanensis]|uniref:Uncharacterized protein n=1 Tax=Stephania yunnanensis TaxID=152371 RepID=A0AAP0LEB6_9MAGN